MFGLRRIAFICYLVGRSDATLGCSDATLGRSDATLGRSDAAPQKSYRIVGATRRVAHCGASPPVMHRPGAAVPRPKNPAQPYRIVGATRRVAHCGASPTRCVAPKNPARPYRRDVAMLRPPRSRQTPCFGNPATAHDGGAIIWPGANSGAQEAGRLPPRLRA